MKQITVNISANHVQRDYKILIGRGLVDKISNLFDFGQYSKVIIVTDRRVAKLFLKKIKKNISVATSSIILPTGENHKNIASVGFIWKKLYESRADRKTLVINLGGGVIGDIGGFAASTFMRGINCLQIPTTLLSQVDAGIGGKTGINFAGIKNLIGTFNQSIGTVIDTQTLESLSKREFLSGFAEILKHGLICDRNYFFQVTSKLPLEFNNDELVEIITKSCRIKADIVEKDALESGRRKLLNFGHTIGHAIEALSLEGDKPLLHGEAVAIGMVGESKLANLIGLLPKSDLMLIKESIKKIGLPIKIKNIAKEKVSGKIINDKKNIRGKILWSLPEKVGRANINIEVEKRFITEAIEYIFD